ncbi:hypothetical protein BFZC1_02917 [Lysinibacillus fusiformis ZC1]|uniref:hypothetical protein n=1 Tax=Lysinibacillus capsici TaxID=2115968 RepID=UPI0001DA5259|nr:hypothetical protein [Lysinibacillus capsici]EFI70137.1 hypothetical protein BFZC1_02917 [Lysinibacillus fusiformis ZC1]EKU44055.1 hypothetical protein C518_0692 [Lysinibacillus fusiformis ZB2]
MVKLGIDQKALQNFHNLFGSFMEEHISTYYNPNFIINSQHSAYSLSFLKDIVIVSMIENDTISDIKRFDYNDLIPDSFLNQLLNLESLPSRVQRYRKIGVERLRLEIIDELRLGAITTIEDSTAIWDDYSLKIKISEELQMKQIDL